MSQRVITLKTDLSKMLEVVSLPGVLAGDDRAANVIRVEVYDGSEPHELTGKITGTILLPNDTTFVVDGISNWHTAQIQLPQEAYVLPGRLSFVIRETTTDQVKTALAAGVCAVRRTATDAVFDPGNAIPSAEDLLTQIRAMETATAAANAAAQYAVRYDDTQALSYAQQTQALANIGAGTVIQEINLFDYSGSYTRKKTNGTTFTKYTSSSLISATEGVFPAADSNGTDGAVWWTLPGRTLPAGTYTLSAYVSLATASFRYVCAGIGRGNYKNTYLMTERGGSTRIASDQTSGWISVTYTLAEDTEFAILLQVHNNTDKPSVGASGFSMIQLEQGDAVTAYVPHGRTAVDTPARERIEALRTEAAAGIEANTDELSAIGRQIRAEKGNIYLGAGVTLGIESGTGGSLLVSFSGRLNFKLLGDNNGAKGWDVISQNLTESQIVIDENSATITIPNYYWLVYNLTDQQLYLRSNNGSGNYKLLRDDLVLLYNAYSQPVSGILHEKWLDQTLREVRKTAEDAYTAASASSVDTEAAATEFASYVGNTSGQFEAFLFFTDPHLVQSASQLAKFESYMDQLRTWYNATPASFVLCGGDWLGNSDLPEEAFYKLSRVRGALRKRFDRYYLAVGNHDTNYQGYSTEEARAAKGAYDGRVSQKSLENVWFDGGKTYCTFTTENTQYFVLDTGIESSSRDSAYYLSECQWFADQLQNAVKPHITLMMHQVYSYYENANHGTVLNDVAAKILEIAGAYNAAGNETEIPVHAVTIGGREYTFTNGHGHSVDYVLAGHTHRDLFHCQASEDNSLCTYGIPCVITRAASYSSSVLTFDFVIMDYAQSILHLVRIGEGDSRHFRIDGANSIEVKADGTAITAEEDDSV